MDLSEWGVWSWTGIATQANVAGGAITIDVTAGAGNEIWILYAGAVGTFAAADALVFQLFDEDNSTVNTYAWPADAAGLTISFPRANTNIDSTTSDDDATAISGCRLVGSDLKFVCTTSALAQNDTVAFRFVALVRRGPGVISEARSGGTVTVIAPTVNEVY